MALDKKNLVFFGILSIESVIYFIKQILFYRFLNKLFSQEEWGLSINRYVYFWIKQIDNTILFIDIKYLQIGCNI